MDQLSYDIQTANGPRLVVGNVVSSFIAFRQDKGLNEWVIDHTTTGLRIAGVKSEEAARNVAESIADVIDWSRVTGKSDAELPEEMIGYIKKATGQHRVPKFGSDWPEPPKKSFSIDIEGSYTLTVEQLWPDGDWPENPTEEDVLALIEKAGGANRIIAEWDLDVEATVIDCGEAKERLKQLAGRSKIITRRRR